ncbi:hypothetical protein L1987_14496 [Smallanthus sonchifolius]|uniref:Uncharacterized protein n=1 Tax=Smallanthus sonchifolius TaxID=185202 RepID=A0ACB9J5J5_9ASTR|nr:hypothetical protein L1987_14496 [Smallanthus sonchifolius]
MASSLTLREFIASSLRTRSIIQFRRRFLNTHDHSSNRVNRHRSSIADVFRTACYFLFDLYPWSPVRMISFHLNSLDCGILGPARHIGLWKVRQNTEALLLHRCDIFDDGTEKMTYLNVSVERNSDILNGPRNRTLVDGKTKNLGTGVVRMERKSVNQPAVLITERQLLQKSDCLHDDEKEFGVYKMWIDLQCDLYDTNAIKIERENQVLKITVPKLKPEWIYKVGIKCEW